MKTNFRKVVGLLLALVMVFSVCTVAFATTTSSTELTIKDFGVTGGEGSLAIVDDPVNAGEKVLEMVANGGPDGCRNNFELADPTDTSKKFEPVAGTTYTVSFDYYSTEETTTDTPDFLLYYGAQPAYSAKYSKVKITSDNIGIVAEKGKWCSASMIFTAATKTGKVNDVADQLLPYLYLTFYAPTNETVKGYIKNIKISVGEDVCREYAGDTSHLVNDDGTFKVAKDSYNYGSCSPFSNNKCYLKKDGTFVYVPDNSNDYGTSSSLPSQTGTQYLKMFNKASGSKIVLKPGKTYLVTLNYEILSVNSTSGFAGVAVGYNYENGRGVSTVGWATTYLVDGNVYTSATTSKQTLVCKFDYTSTANGDLIICLSGNGSEIALYDYTVSEISTTSEKYAFVSYNDNGNITIAAEAIGADITRVGNNAENTALKEKFIGWYADPQFTTPVTTYSTDYTTLYAKYPSVVIDFNHRTAYGTEGYGINTTNRNSVADGVYTYNSVNSNVGFILPSYDANIKDAVDKNAFYQFKDGYEYKITFVINKNGTACTPTLTPSTNAGLIGGRNQNGEQSYTWISATEEPITVSKVLTFKLPSSTVVSNYQDYNTYTIRHFGNNNVVEFDKIIITQITDMDDYKVGSVSFVDNGKTVKTSTTAGQVIEAPTPAGVDGKLFIGWYEQNYDAYKSGDVSASSAPVSFAKVGVNEVIYEARYIDASTTTIDIDNYYLISQEWNSYLTDSSADRSKNFKITADESDNYFLDVKNVGSGPFKTSLFTDSTGTKSVVYEGVRYEVEVDYEVVTTDGDNASDAYITFVHSSINEFRPYDLNFENGSTRLEKFSNAESGRHTVTGYFTAKDLHVAKNGSVEGGANRRESELSLVVSGGYANVYSVKITPVSYTPVFEAKYDSTKGAVQVHFNSDGITGTISAKPVAGYTLAANGVKLVRTYKDYTLSADNKNVTVSAAPFYGLALNTTDGSEFTFDLSKLSADMLRTLRVEVDFVAESEADNAAFIGASIRNQSAAVTAGLRFRARISDATVAAAQKIEFVAVPENELTDCNGLVKDYTGSMAVTGVAYEKDGKNIVYDASIDGFTDYQVCITGLNESAQALKIAVAVKITGADNTVTWIQINNNQSFNGLK